MLALGVGVVGANDVRSARGAGELLAAGVVFLVAMRALMTGWRVQSAVVLGDALFVEVVGRRATEAGRRVVATMALPVTIDMASEGLTFGRFDELIVQGDGLVRLRDLSPELRSQARQFKITDLDGASWREPFGNPFVEPIPRFGRVAKRAADIVLSAAGLLVASPLLLAAMAAIRIDSKGPALLRQVRVGACGSRFTLFKLRTMVVNNDASQHHAYVASLIEGKGARRGGMYKLTDDPRITRVGRFLRRYSLDEMPQLWNVLRGSMSLVGPRPILPNEVELYRTAALQRLRVKPGLTGLWQVGGRCELTFDEMIDLDTQYWRAWTPRMELEVLLRTPRAVLSGRGAS